MNKKVGLPPVINLSSRILILGSMPGEISLEKRQYYGNSRNDFWPMVFTLLQKPLPQSYNQRIEIILKRGIALWDVLENCRREGSSDSKIREGQPNDFAKLFAHYPGLRAVFFNGKKAGDLFRNPGITLPPGVKSFYLPSSSPAHTITREEKIGAWKRILIFLD